MQLTKSFIPHIPALHFMGCREVDTRPLEDLRTNQNLDSGLGQNVAINILQEI